ncbi:acyl-CoA Delta-9 desaturase-like [Microplitis mediator]|uniref:acyl-CoA Delta-9 desaturase-like n=1 Tax=Microplitis mediator TaxID=375433 RepID=UPI002556BB5D|nr:acyl-CoA Delta-9 desaturase-like [Microplitis mediator]
MTEFLEDKSRLKKKMWYEFQTKLVWKPVIFMTVLHLVSLYYFVTFPYWQQLGVFMFAFIISSFANFGVTAGAHRLWTHRAYKAKTPLRIILAVFFYMAGQNSIHYWVRDHRVHHKYTDTPADPHDNTRGFWFSHVGWLVMKRRPEVFQRGKKIDMSDILNDPVVQFFDRHSFIFTILLTIVLPIVIPVYIFGHSWKWTIIAQIFMRYPWCLNATWSVNSFAHMFGYHSYDKNIRPAENIFVSFVAAGEGWHNYHHTFPWDYKTSEFKSFFFNNTTNWIDLFAKIGWAYDLRQASPELIKLTAERRGDGTHPNDVGKSIN